MIKTKIDSLDKFPQLIYYKISIKPINIIHRMTQISIL